MNIFTDKSSAAFTESSKRIKCIDCKYARVSGVLYEKDWKGYECGNPDSEHFMALLNVTVNGVQQGKITWPGCDKGKEETV